MNTTDVRAILETVDVLRLLAMRGRREIREFARYMFVFGVYPAFNIFADLLFGRTFWVHTLFVAFWLATVRVAGPWFTFLVWSAAAVMVSAVYIWTQSVLWTIVAVIAAVFFAQMTIYGYAIHSRRYRPAQPFKLSIAPKIGWAWGMIMGGMAVVVHVLGRHHPLHAADYITLWGYAIGVGLFISGLMAPGFFVLGGLGILGVPLLSLWTPKGAYALEGVLGLLMALYAVWLHRTAPPDLEIPDGEATTP